MYENKFKTKINPPTASLHFGIQVTNGRSWIEFTFFDSKTGIICYKLFENTKENKRSH